MFGPQNRPLPDSRGTMNDLMGEIARLGAERPYRLCLLGPRRRAQVTQGQQHFTDTEIERAAVADAADPSWPRLRG